VTQRVGRLPAAEVSNALIVHQILGEKIVICIALDLLLSGLSVVRAFAPKFGAILTPELCAPDFVTGSTAPGLVQVARMVTSTFIVYVLLTLKLRLLQLRGK
jgi:hypothetical protein